MVTIFENSVNRRSRAKKKKSENSSSYFMFLLTGLYVFIIGVFIKILHYIRTCRSTEKPLVQVLVLGDIGHSPRMQYHALSLANSGRFMVELVGYRGSDPLESILMHPSISLRYLRQFASPFPIPFILYGISKVFFDTVQLLLIFLTRTSQCVLIQTPPAVPSIILSLFTGVVLDFHNITYMHLSSKLDESKFVNRQIVCMVRMYETFLSKFAHSSFCVTTSMREFLITEFKLSNVTTLYDRPGPQFYVSEKKSKLELSDAFFQMAWIGSSPQRPALSEYKHIMVSATSWTEDEYFPIMLEALPVLDLKLEKTLLLITGKGSGRLGFENEFRKINLKNIDLVTGWVTASDYPYFLKCADLGISFHSSTSGLDLPMKLVDMLGANLPVVAYDFFALKELSACSYRFRNAAELSEHLLDLTVNSGAIARRKSAQKMALEWRESDWNSEWKKIAWPIFSQFSK